MITAFGLMERADQILPKPMIHSRFPSDAGIHLRHQRGRDLHIRNAALIDRGGEPGQVADDTASKRHNQRTAFKPVPG